MPRWSSPATQPGLRCLRECRGRRSRSSRTRGHGAPRRGNGCHGVERLPVDQMERRAGEGGRTRERAADRVRQVRGTREHPDDRRRVGLHGLGERLRRRQDGACGLLLHALSQGVQARRRRLDRDQAAEEPERSADTLRHAAVQARGARRVGATRARKRRSSPHRCGETSSARRTTCSASSCSRRRSSSPA